MFYGAGRGGGRGHRNMYYATGLPGWMRGMSPGGPCAQFLMTGQWPTPQAQTAWQAMQAGAAPAAGLAADPASQLGMLRSQAELLRQQLAQLEARIAQLENQG